MTTLGWSPRDQRVLISGIVAMIAIAAIGRGLPAARAWNSEQVARAASLMSDVAAGQTARRRVVLARASLAIARERAAAADSSMLLAASPSAAAALLASLVADAADSSRVKIIAMQLHADSVRAESLVRVSVRITAAADVGGLLAFLRAIESSDVLMAVDELALSQSEPAAGDDKPEMLRLEIEVSSVSRQSVNKL